MFIKPASEDVIILDPDTKRRMPAEGWEVPVNAFWCRRLRDGDVIECEQPKNDEPQQQEWQEPQHNEWHEENH